MTIASILKKAYTASVENDGVVIQTANVATATVTTPVPAPTATITAAADIVPEADFATATKPVGGAEPTTATVPAEDKPVVVPEVVEPTGETDVDTISTTATKAVTASNENDTTASTTSPSGPVELETTPIAPVVADPSELTEPTEPTTRAIGEGVVDLVVEIKKEVNTPSEIASVAIETLTEGALNAELAEQATEGVEVVTKLENSIAAHCDIVEAADKAEQLASVDITNQTEADRSMTAISQESILMTLGLEDSDLALPEIQSALSEATTVTEKAIGAATADVLVFIAETYPLVIEKIKRLDAAETVAEPTNSATVGEATRIARELLDTIKRLLSDDKTEA